MLSILSCGRFLLFFTWRIWRKICLFQLISCKLVVLRIYFCNTCGRTFPKGSCHWEPHRPCELKVPVSPGGQFVVTENVQRRQHFFMPNSGSTCNQALGKVGFPVCKLEWNVSGQTPKGLCLTASFLWSFTPPRSAIQYLGHHSPLRAYEASLSGRSLELDPSIRGPEYLVTSPLVLEARGLGHHRLGAQGILVLVRANQTVQDWDRSQWRAPCRAVLTPPQSSPGTQT